MKKISVDQRCIKCHYSYVNARYNKKKDLLHVKCANCKATWKMLPFDREDL